MVREKTEKQVEKRKPRIQNEPLLTALHGGAEDEGVESEYELERRYLPARLLSVEQLNELSKGEHREIAQGYLRALDATGEPQTFRLRVTEQKGKEGVLYRIAQKAKVEGSRARMEKQIKFPPSDDADAEDFTYLWERYVQPSEVVRKTRYYIQHRLPNGNECEIHYDVHHGKDMEGLVRIEVEFRGENADEDEKLFWEGNGDQGALLPDWIGQDVTDDPDYGGKILARKGFPPHAHLLMQTLGAR